MVRTDAVEVLSPNGKVRTAPDIDQVLAEIEDGQRGLALQVGGLGVGDGLAVISQHRSCPFGSCRGSCLKRGQFGEGVQNRLHKIMLLHCPIQS